jgi:alginate O-acetyltransferase complex protein AlgJ
MMLPETTQGQIQTYSKITWEQILRLLPGSFMLAVLALGILVFLKPSTYFFPEGSWINGQAAATYEKHFNENLPLRQTYIDTWGIIEYGLFHQGREGVLVGQQGWLYSTEELAHYDDEAKRVEQKLEYVREVKDTLASRGIQLIVTIVPSKARIYPENLGRYTFPSYARGRYQYIQEALEAEGIPVAELITPFLNAKEQGLLYFNSDTHWTPYGARVAASAISAMLRDAGYDLPFDTSSFKTNVTSTTTFKGDLSKYVPLGILEPLWGSTLETVQDAATVQTDLGLFADNSTPVALVGSSYSGDARWNFAGALKEALGINVMNAAQVGQGEVMPMKDFLASQALAINPPKLVIWQVSERGFPMPAETQN